MPTLPDLMYDYLALGWELVPITAGKSPKGLKGWQNIRRDDYTPEGYAELFDGHGVGLQLGNPSEHIVDVDLDCPEAKLFAPYIFDRMTLRLGHENNPDSHYLYHCPDLGFDEKDVVRDPMTKSDSGALKTLLELRSTGQQQVIPPSMHPSGVPYRWEGKGLVAPVTIPAVFLKAEFYLLGALTLLARHWGKWESSRHEIWLAFIGGVIRTNPAYWTHEGRIEDLSEMFGRVVGYHDVGMLVDAARTTVEKAVADAPYTGWQTLYNILTGDWSALVDEVKRCIELGYSTPEPSEDEVAEDYEGEYGIWSHYGTDLTAMMQQEVPPPKPVIPGFLWENMEHTLYGEAGTGKTLLTCHIIMELALQGHHSIWVDFQNGSVELTRRFQSMQLPPEAAQYIHIVEFPPANLMDPETLKSLQAMILQLDARLLVLDSMMDVLAYARSEMNSADDYNALHGKAIRPLRNTGRVALLTHDHAAKHDGGRSIGTSMKRNNVEVEWQLDNGGGKKNPPSLAVGGAGFIRAVLKKGRGIPLALGDNVAWYTEPHGPITTDAVTGRKSHTYSRTEMHGHFAAGVPLVMASGEIPSDKNHPDSLL